MVQREWPVRRSLNILFKKMHTHKENIPTTFRNKKNVGRNLTFGQGNHTTKRGLKFVFLIRDKELFEDEKEWNQFVAKKFK